VAPDNARSPPVATAIVQADAGTRTPDPFITSEVLYQLSYVGICPANRPFCASARGAGLGLRAQP
jgi:hypothetical protein